MKWFLLVLVAVGLAIAISYHSSYYAPASVFRETISRWLGPGDLPLPPDGQVRLGSQMIEDATPEPGISAPTPHPAALSRAQAMRTYPALAQVGSRFNVRFLANYDELRKRNPGFLAQPDWPMKLGFFTGVEVGFRPPWPNFTITTQGGSNYLLKMGAPKSPDTALTVFMWHDQTLTVKVPFGIYGLKYAAGKKWYGYQKLFGPETTYGEVMTPIVLTDGMKSSITLFQTIAPDLQTKAISAADF